MQRDEAITRAEREDLQRLIRQREKVLKTAAKQRSAELLADFESQLGSQFAFDADHVWAEAAKIAEREVERANKQIAARCAELGIPKNFAPRLALGWISRFENATKQRRGELRKMAVTRTEAIEREAITKIEMASINAQTEIAVSGLTSEAAKVFVAQLPAVENLMPALSFDAIAGDAAPPVAEQLVTPGALRQRRYRERLAQRHVTSLPHSGDANGDDLEAVGD